ncbi:MAG: MarR family transcriptional regulator [Rhodospirillaceae bacterium]|nr:MarR family transcriptional regulator [Rhodospirillaceae bacterium]
MNRTQPQRREHARSVGALRRDEPAASPVSGAKPSVRDDFQLESHVFFWLTEVIGRRNRLLAAALKPFGLRVPEWRVLASLHSRHRASFKELAELASFDQTTLSRTIDRFVRDGLVVRLSDVEDMRVTRLALTAKGERLFQDLWPAVDELNAASCAGLPEGGAAMLRWLLGEMRNSLDDMIAARHPPRSGRRAGRTE